MKNIIIFCIILISITAEAQCRYYHSDFVKDSVELSGSRLFFTAPILTIKASHEFVVSGEGQGLMLPLESIRTDSISENKLKIFAIFIEHIVNTSYQSIVERSNKVDTIWNIKDFNGNMSLFFKVGEKYTRIDSHPSQYTCYYEDLPIELALIANKIIDSIRYINSYDSNEIFINPKRRKYVFN